MRIAHYIPALLPVRGYGGTERVVYWMAEEQASLGHELTLLAHAGSLSPFANCVSLPAHSDEWHRVLAAGSFDVVHFHSLPPRGFPRDFPHVITIHGNGKPGEFFSRNAVFVSKNHAARHASKNFVHNGIKLANYPLKRARGPSKTAMFLAKASWRVKNLRGALEIAKNANHRILVAGGRRPLAPWGLFAFHARFFGNVDDKTKIELLHQSDALIFPVLWQEPFGLALIEALACGVPIAGTKLGALPEIVSPDCGFLSDSVDELTACLAQEISKFSPEVCRERVEQNFSAQKMALSYLEIYKRVLKDGYLSDDSPHTLVGPS